MTDYSGWDKAALIVRLQELEVILEASNSGNSRHALALKESEERMRAILETAVEGILTIDERGLVESLNPAAEKLFGYRAEEVLGRNVSMLMPSPYREQHDGYLERYQRTGQARIIGIGREVVGRRKDGSVFPMDLSVGEVNLPNRRLFTGIVRDITARRRAEQQILEISGREQRRIGQDLHDGLGQHLTGIELLSQCLEQDLARAKRPEAAQAAKISKHVREAILQTKSLARGLSPVDLEQHGMMFALQELCRSTSELCRVKCRFECPKPIAIPDNTMATHLYRIAQEAVNNAVKHGRAAEITVTLAEAERDQLLLSIRDNGRGFTPGREGKENGMGMGIMKYRAGVIGGALEVSSATDQGTQVRCIFPRPKA
jgi:two-component system, LuxR family, sensor kinase FixL